VAEAHFDKALAYPAGNQWPLRAGAAPHNTRAAVHLFGGDFTDAASLVAQAQSVTEARGAA
jgi:hypothetical protein